MVEPDEGSNSDIDRDLRQPLKYDHRHPKSNPGALELAMMQCGNSSAARSALGGLTDLRECTVWVNERARIDYDRELFD
jgi:hypothetical protein